MGSKVTIKSGTYRANGHSQVIYLQKASKVVIEGGEFTSMNETYAQKFTLNLKDDLLKAEGAVPTDFIEIKGGRFYKYDPSRSESENPAANFVAAGYKSVQDGDYYVVKAE